MRRAAWLLAAVLASLAQGAEEKSSSPDGRFALHVVMQDEVARGVQVIESKSGRVVADLSEDAMEPGAMRLLWTKDSKGFAANFRAGGRYETTAFFRWTGKSFAELKSPEEGLYEKIIEPAKRRELKAAGKATDTSLRRIWDTWETVKWIDSETAEVLGESTSAYPVGDGETADISVAVRATVRFDAKGGTILLKAEEVPAKD